MKQKVSIWSLPIHLGLFCLLFFIPQLLGAQENNDSVRITRDKELLKPTEILPHSTIDLLPEKEIIYPVSPTEEPGLDIGAILYEVLRETVFDNRQNSGPTMAPPRLSLPIR